MILSRKFDFPGISCLFAVFMWITFPRTVFSRSTFVKTFSIEVPKMAEQEQFTKPWFCHGLDCPAFKVVDTTKNYEEREYVGTKWVSTYVEGTDYDDASSTMFMKLFRYIEGNNAKKQKIAMTAPVLVSVVAGQGPACKSNLTMSFFLAPSLTDPPAPSDKSVYISALPKQNVYVKSFGGFAKGSSWVENAEALAQSLVKDNKNFQKSQFYTAGYDSPFRILDRHNEVWYAKA